jgi:hypothetical protein
VVQVQVRVVQTNHLVETDRQTLEVEVEQAAGLMPLVTMQAVEVLQVDMLNV